MEKKAVHFWSRISEVGQKAFEEALKVFNPVSNDPLDTETQLVAFLQGLREEGCQPTVLKSKDVYGYSSCTAKSPNPLAKVAKNLAEAAKASKISSKNSLKVSNSNSTPKVLAERVPLTHSSNFLLSSLQHKSTSLTKTLRPDFHVGGQPAMQLSVVLEALVPLTLSKLQKRSSLNIPKSSLLLISKASRMFGQSAGKNSKALSAHLPLKGCSTNLVKKVSSSGKITVRPVNGTIIRGPNGKILKESSALKASRILNGRFSTVKADGKGRLIKDTSGKMTKKLNCKSHIIIGQKRERDGKDETTVRKKTKHSHLIEVDKTRLHKKTLKLLNSKAIKVSKWSSEDEVRRKAQEILKVNLSPELKIRPLRISPVVRIKPLKLAPIVRINPVLTHHRP